MSIAAANVVPVFHHRRSLSTAELQRLQEPCVILEHEGFDSDGAQFWVYTVGGVLDGEVLPMGCTIAGNDVIVISGMDCREQADEVACLGLLDTITALDQEFAKQREAQRSLDRLASIGRLERLDLAMRPNSEKSDAFVNDVDAIRPLIGDDILLAAGEVVPAAQH